ncbi:hypothetical protein RHMOL_Rhmol13G0162900 [Rhododendron molle]|uniref:Uncharacterized protein n=2 Tax=Rhododendron molle TaxID=49168 RepID=A0ACC0L7C8_RHOML|nr:hypothetical protein RHMOL_Rhmol13G0162900 [Rhododendron molle]KAI8524623.1 hypothetical protein RHMOL_Rhmol13G0162900 [Rhododendron molle]
MLSSPWDAAKHMESAAALAKELSNWSEVADFYRRASELYIECGRSQPASDALAKGARVLEDTAPDEAIRLYIDACEILEEDGKEQMAFDLYRAATSVYIKLEKYDDAATFLLRLGLAADKCNATHSQCKIECLLGVVIVAATAALKDLVEVAEAYLSAIIVYLYANDFKQAEKCYNDCCQIDAFLSSDQIRCASKLFSAYTDGDVEEIKRVAQSSTVKNLDHMINLVNYLDGFYRNKRLQIIRLAKKLPTGEVSALKAEQEEALDEDDLT